MHVYTNIPAADVYLAPSNISWLCVIKSKKKKKKTASKYWWLCLQLYIFPS